MKKFNWIQLVPVSISILAQWLSVFGGFWGYVGILFSLISLVVSCIVTEWFTIADPTGPPPSALDPMPQQTGALAF